MMSFTTILAVVLITAPADSPCVNPGVPLPTLQFAALALELISPNECRYTFASIEGNAFETDLRIVRVRWAELHDAPPLYDAMRWPDKETIDAVKHTNIAYRSWLVDRQRLFPAAEWIIEAVGECDALYVAWDLAADARSDYYGVFYRRRALKQLRGQIGLWAYYAGAMPPPVPAWRFRRVD